LDPRILISNINLMIVCYQANFGIPFLEG